MSVVLEPSNQLTFKRPLTQPIEEFLYVRNIGNEPVAFKVKTTAPKQYCVKPNSGVIPPSSDIEVQVIFQPFKEEPAPDFKCKDKFLVQTAIVKPEWSDWNMVELWSNIESDHRESMSQRKVKCVFLPPELPLPSATQQDSIDQPPTPTSSHDRSTNDTTHHNGDNDNDSNGTNSNNSNNNNNDIYNGNGGRGSATPSPTLSSTLPAIIDAAKKSASSKPYDPAASSVSLLTAHTSVSPHPMTKTPVALHHPSLPPPLSPTTSPSPPSPSPPVAVPMVNVQTSLVEQMEKEKQQLQLDLSSALEREKTLQQQMAKEQADLKTARALVESTQSLVENLQQQIKTLKYQQSGSTDVKGDISSSSANNTASAVANAAAHAMQSSPLPMEGYPPQVLLSVSALVFIFTYLFF